jgi:hypothetical protein
MGSVEKIYFGSILEEEAATVLTDFCGLPHSLQVNVKI